MEKLKQVLILVFAITSLNLYCQPILNDSTKAYNYWSKRGIIEMVYASMQDYLSTVDTIKLAKENQGAKNFQKIFIANIDTKTEAQISNDFDSIVQFLKNNHWSELSSKVCIPLMVKQKQKQKLNDRFYSTDILYNQNKKWEEKKVSVLNEYNTSLLSLSNKPFNKGDGDISVNEPNNVDSIFNTHIASLIINILFLLVGILIGFLFVFFYSKSQIESILAKEEIKKYKDELRNSHERYLFTYIGLFFILKKSKDEYKSKFSRDTKNNVQHSNNYYPVDNLKKEFEELKIQNKKLLEENIQLGEVIEKNKYQSVTLEIKEIEPDKKSNEQEHISNLKFFTIPENDGSFKIASGKNNRETDCFYKVEVDKNGQKGRLYFISGDYDSRALDSIDYYLNPVCEIENITERIHARKIQMLETGIVILVSDSWKIDINHKVKIKLL